MTDYLKLQSIVNTFAQKIFCIYFHHVHLLKYDIKSISNRKSNSSLSKNHLRQFILEFFFNLQPSNNTIVVH